MRSMHRFFSLFTQSSPLLSTMLVPVRVPKNSSSEPHVVLGIRRGSRPPRAVSNSRRRMSPKRPRTLPQELIDRIIDCLRDQQRLLAKCAAVSRAFVRRSQQHIFAKIILFPSLEHRFMTLLESSPHLIPYIQDLSVAISNPRLPTWQPSPLPKILPLLTQRRIKSLNIKVYGGGVVDWGKNIHKALRDALASVFLGNRLEAFILQDIQNFDPLLPAQCASLRMLVIGGEGSMAPFIACPYYPFSPPPLSVMMIGTGQDAFQSLMSCCTPASPAFALSNLQWLGLRELPGPEWIKAFRNLAQSSLSKLRHLVLELEVKQGAYFPSIITNSHQNAFLSL